MFSQEQKGYFKRLLNRQLDEILKKNAHAISRIAEMTETSFDFTDQATLESDIGFNIHLKARDIRLARKIKEALARLDGGTFGLCEECGEASVYGAEEALLMGAIALAD